MLFSIESGSYPDEDVVLCRVSKQLSIHQLPPILILHIKRFKLGCNSVTKDPRYLSFPEVLNMAPYCTDDSGSSNRDGAKVIFVLL